ncbi:MAG: hypothetical protein CMN87_18325 [Stappia sp.]|uniref:hypothetical protein n=1 Tax=Stappia sp. TaxID=1870903 RepID=UPI000C68CF30|nr:hypothetical protein [Stappia sp.]MAA97428.1 hypothetical protein [Stappia sp.]MBM21961.1 hypothetical protein [Stappia sp.]
MTLSIDEIEARRRQSGVNVLDLCSASGVVISHYARLRDGVNQPRPATLSSLSIALRRLAGGTPANDGGALQLYRLSVALCALHAGADPEQVLAQDPTRRASANREWMAAAQIRRRALYIAHVCCGVSQAVLAKVAGMTPAAVSLTIRAIEDARGDNDDDAIGVIERVMQLDT